MNRRVLYPTIPWLFWSMAWPIGLIAVGFVAVAMTDADTLLFDHPHLWWLGVAGPAAGAIGLYGLIRRRRAIHRFASSDLAPLLAERLNPSRRAMRTGLIVTAVLLIVAGIIGPRWGVYYEKHKVRGVDIVVALDVSRSMLARDVTPNRLERAKREIRQQLLERAVFQRAHRLALLAFAGSTSLRMPLTTDHLSFRTKLEAVSLGSAPRGGTAIGEAVRAAADLFARSPQDATKVILLFTDGEDHEGAPTEAVKEAFDEQGIRTFTIGVGDRARMAGAQVPAGLDEPDKPLLHEGQIVFSRLNEGSLRDIAQAGEGRYAPILHFPQLVDAVAGMRQADLTTEERVRHQSRYQWFIAAALILLGLESMMGDRLASIAKLPQRVWQQEAA